MSRDWAVTDIQPRTMMCPLPKGYRWEVRLIQSLDTVHLDLVKRRNFGPLKSKCVVLDFSQTSSDRAVRKIIDGSYTMWQSFFHASHDKNDEWEARANDLRDALSHPGVNVKVRVEKVR